jgi:hypothetical protein
MQQMTMAWRLQTRKRKQIYVMKKTLEQQQVAIGKGINKFGMEPIHRESYSCLGVTLYLNKHLTNQRQNAPLRRHQRCNQEEHVHTAASYVLLRRQERHLIYDDETVGPDDQG